MENCIKRYKIWIAGPKSADGIQIFEPLERKQHQEEGVRWCLSRELEANCGGIVADEMGLGKTFEMMGLMVAHQVEHTLIVVPPALLDQWKACLTKYVCGKRGLHVFHGRGAKGDLILKTVILTTYMMVGKLCEKTNIVWGRIIFDEAHHLRNSGTKIHCEARKLRSPLKWGCTGTPIQNRLQDLYALCRILTLPCDISRREEYMLRRTKASVGLILPAVKQTDVVIAWKTEEEADFAREIHELIPLRDVNGQNVDSIIAELGSLSWNNFVRLLRARQVCVYPMMLSATLEDRVDEMFLEGISSSKIDAVVENVSQKNGNSKLVFCHFRAEIDILAERLRGKGLSVGVIDGRVAKGKRKELLSLGDHLGANLFDEIFKPHLNRTKSHRTDWLYNTVSDYLAIDVLIVQIQTACEGLNLQQYQEVHFVSPHWNPAVEEQAIARCHRMGQKRPVSVFRYIMDDVNNRESFEQYCKNVQDVKREIMKLID